MKEQVGETSSRTVPGSANAVAGAWESAVYLRGLGSVAAGVFLMSFEGLMLWDQSAPV